MDEIANQKENSASVDLSFVIPVFNGSQTIPAVVDGILQDYDSMTIEVVLVNDGSSDDSESVCGRIHEKHPEKVTFIHFARNFGEHNAVLAGLNHGQR